jgi:hypothetical protein
VVVFIDRFGGAGKSIFEFSDTPPLIDNGEAAGPIAPGGGGIMFIDWVPVGIKLELEACDGLGICAPAEALMLPLTVGNGWSPEDCSWLGAGVGFGGTTKPPLVVEVTRPVWLAGVNWLLGWTGRLDWPVVDV